MTDIKVGSVVQVQNRMGLVVQDWGDELYVWFEHPYEDGAAFQVAEMTLIGQGDVHVEEDEDGYLKVYRRFDDPNLVHWPYALEF